MRKIGSLFIFLTLILALLSPASLAEAKDKHHHMKNYKCEENVTLTKKQKKKLDHLFDELYEKKKEIFETVAEYGMISKEQKNKHIKLMKEHTKQMKKAKNEWCQD